MERPGSAMGLYGTVNKSNPYDLSKSIYQLSSAGADNIIGVRVTGQYAETILPTGVAATAVTLEEVSAGVHFTANGSTKVFQLVDGDGNNVKWLATLEIEPTLTTAILPGSTVAGVLISPTVTIGDDTDAIIAEDWVEGQDFWVNYKDGIVEFAYAPDTGFDGSDIVFTNVTAWPYAIRLQSIYPGDLYNTDYSGNEINSSMLVTVNSTATELTITSPAERGTRVITVELAATDTNYEVALAINRYLYNNFVRAYVDGDNNALQTIVANYSTPPTDTGEGDNAPWNSQFFTWYNEPTYYWEAIGGLVEDDMDAWNRLATFRRFHYGDAEELSLANIPGVTGLPAPFGVTVGSHEVRSSVYLKYYYAAHSTVNFKQDLYNALLYRNSQYVECLPNGTGVYYNATTGVPTTATEMGLKADFGVLDVIEKFDFIWLVPKCMWVDTKVYKYTEASGVFAAELTSYAELLCEFVASAWERGSHPMLSMAYSPISNPTLLGIDSYVSTIINHAAALDMASVSGVIGATIDAGRYVVLSAGPEVMVKVPGQGDVWTTCEALVAANIASLDPGSAPINMPLRGAMGMRYSFTLQQLDDLIAAHMMVIDGSYIDRTIRMLGNATMAADLSVSQPSDYTKIRTMRIVTTAVNMIANIARPWIGKSNSSETRNSLKRAVDQRLMDMAKNGLLNAFQFTIHPVTTGIRADILKIDLSLTPTDSIDKIEVTVTVRR